MSDEYQNAKIVNIRKGSKTQGRDLIVYAELRNDKGELLIAATLDYILVALRERLQAPA